jgi:hypothetical protein
MRVIERHILGKSDDPAACEDGIVVTDDHAVVIDGATDNSAQRFDGLTGGRFAMRAVSEAVGKLPADADAPAAVRQLSAHLADTLPDTPLATARPTASVTLYCAARREIWQIGDVAFWYEGLDPALGRPRKHVDRAAADMRAAVIAAHLAAGADPAELTWHDPGREAIRPLLTRQGALANNPDPGVAQWAYGVIDGREVPGHLITVHPVPAGVREVVIASDGYPMIWPTLAQTEARLAALLGADPLCIGPLRGTKAAAPGANGFDDRAYLRLALSPAGR